MEGGTTRGLFLEFIGCGSGVSPLAAVERYHSAVTKALGAVQAGALGLASCSVFDLSGYCPLCCMLPVRTPTIERSDSRDTCGFQNTEAPGFVHSSGKKSAPNLTSALPVLWPRGLCRASGSECVSVCVWFWFQRKGSDSV